VSLPCIADVFGVLLQYPATNGKVDSFATLTEQAHKAGAKVVVAADLLSLTVLTPPGEWGADVVLGSAQVLYPLPPSS
jgi:glycine dehydrogenase